MNIGEVKNDRGRYCRVMRLVRVTRVVRSVVSVASTTTVTANMDLDRVVAV